MPRTGRPKADLTVTDAEREQLLGWSRRAKSSQSMALRRVTRGPLQGVDDDLLDPLVGDQARTARTLLVDKTVPAVLVDTFKLSTDPFVHREGP